MTPHHERLVVGLILLGFVILAVGFSLGPIFEGPDEIEHYRYIRTVQRTGMLPDPAGQPNGEYHQAPLYYLLAAPLAALLPEDADFTQIENRRNPYYGFRVATPGNDNKNIFVHTRAEAFPSGTSATARAVHGLRLFSVVIGVGTVITSYAVFQTLWPDSPQRRLFALAVVAFWPQLAYLAGVISNDALAFLLATTTLWLLLRMQRHGPTSRSALALGLVLGAALLTKASLLMLAFPVGVAIASDRRTWRYLPFIVVLTGVVGGWWYVRNALLYGDPTGIQSMLKAWPWLAREPGENGVVESVYAYFTVWARFGYGAVTVNALLYRIFDVLVFFAVAGLLLRAIGYRRRGLSDQPVLRHTITIVAFTLVWIIAVVYGSATARDSNHGRFLLPGIAAWTALQTLGLEMWLPARWRPGLMIASLPVCAVLPAICLFGYFYPAYRTIPVPDTPAQPLSIRYGAVAELTGMSPASLVVRPGQVVSLELYWRALQAASPWLEVHISTEPELESIRRVSLPGNGHRPADDWQPGDQWAERYEIVIPPDLPDSAALVVSLYDAESGTWLSAVDPANGSVVATAPVIGQFVVNSDTGSGPG